MLEGIRTESFNKVYYTSPSLFVFTLSGKGIVCCSKVHQEELAQELVTGYSW